MLRGADLSIRLRLVVSLVSAGASNLIAVITAFCTFLGLALLALANKYAVIASNIVLSHAP